MARNIPPPGTGGARKGAGRKPEWFSNRCKDLFEKGKLLDFVKDVAKGIEHEQKVTSGPSGPEITETKPQIKDRLRATEMLKEWGYGKSVQPITGSVSVVDLIVGKSGDSGE